MYSSICGNKANGEDGLSKVICKKKKTLPLSTKHALNTCQTTFASNQFEGILCWTAHSALAVQPEMASTLALPSNMPLRASTLGETVKIVNNRFLSLLNTFFFATKRSLSLSLSSKFEDSARLDVRTPGHSSSIKESKL